MFPDRHIVSEADPILLEKKDLLDFLCRLLLILKLLSSRFQGQIVPRTARKIRFDLVVYMPCLALSINRFIFS